MVKSVFEIDYSYISNKVDLLYKNCNLKGFFNLILDALMCSKVDDFTCSDKTVRIIDEDWYEENLENETICSIRCVCDDKFNLLINNQYGHYAGPEVLNFQSLILIAEDLKKKINNVLEQNGMTGYCVAIYNIPKPYWDFEFFADKKEFQKFKTNELKRLQRKIPLSARFY